MYAILTIIYNNSSNIIFYLQGGVVSIKNHFQEQQFYRIMRRAKVIGLTCFVCVFNIIIYNHLATSSVLVTKQKTFGHSIKNGKRYIQIVLVILFHIILLFIIFLILSFPLSRAFASSIRDYNVPTRLCSKAMCGNLDSHSIRVSNGKRPTI